VVAMVNTVQDGASFVKITYGLAPGIVAPLPALAGVRVETSWHPQLTHPRGLACDPSGSVFATTGRVADGRRALLQASAVHVGSALSFEPAPECIELDRDRQQQVQDLAFHSCGERGSGCAALVLPRRGQYLVSCPLEDGRPVARANSSQPLRTVPLAREWLEDRGGVPLDGGASPAGLFEPEEMASIATVPCGPGSESGRCAIVGTTARRVVQLVSKGPAGNGLQWVPKRLMRKDHGEVPGPGAFALLGGRYLAALHRNSSQLRVTDLQEGGRTVGSWSLPKVHRGARGGKWSAICAGGDSLFALEDHESPSLWRFGLPSSLTGLTGVQ